MLILGCVLLCAAVIGGAGIISAQRVVDEDSAQIMNKISLERACELNGLLSRIEQSVKTLAVYTAEQLGSVEQLKNDGGYLTAYTKKLEAVAANADSRVSIARGFAIYNSATDLVFGNVFKRADDAMYKNKAVMKEHQK